MRIGIVVSCLMFLTSVAEAQELEEIVVTGTLAGSDVPGKHLRRDADNLLLRVQIVNDSRDEDQREDEIHKTLLSAINAASKNSRIELSTVSASGFVLPLNESNYRIDLENGNRPDTSEAYFRAKSAVTASTGDGEAQVLELKRFVSGLKMVGRTQVFVSGDVEVSIVNPNQYRAEAIKLFAEDVGSVTSALGSDNYRVIVTACSSTQSVASRRHPLKR